MYANARKVVNNSYVTCEPVDKYKKLRRQIEDYLRKYATEKQLDQVADILNIKK